MPKIERHDEWDGSDHGPLRSRCEQKARCSSDVAAGGPDLVGSWGRSRVRRASSWSVRGLSDADALAELFERQPALGDRVTQQRDAALALGIGGEDRRRPGLGGIAHLRHRTALACGSCVHGATSISRKRRRIVVACTQTKALGGPPVCRPSSHKIGAVASLTASGIPSAGRSGRARKIDTRRLSLARDSVPGPALCGRARPRARRG